MVRGIFQVRHPNTPNRKFFLLSHFWPQSRCHSQIAACPSVCRTPGITGTGSMIHFNDLKNLSMRPSWAIHCLSSASVSSASISLRLLLKLHATDSANTITYCQYHLQWVVNDIVFLAVRGSCQIIFNNWIFVQLLVFQNVYDMIGDVLHRGPKKVRNINHRSSRATWVRGTGITEP